MGRAVLLFAALLSGCATAKSTKPEVRSNVRVLRLAGQIGPTAETIDFVDGINAAAEAREPVVFVEVDSPGGYVDVGVAILDSMQTARAAGVSFVCRIGDGAMAASMAAIIFEIGCDYRVMASGSTLMFHEAAMSVQNFRGKSGDWRRIADALDDATKRTAIGVANRLRRADGTHWTAIEYMNWIRDRDRWLDATEALSIGACDQVEP